MGASLIPEFYKQHIKIAVLLAPIARLDHNTAPGLIQLAQEPIRSILVDTVEAIHYYDFLSPVPLF